MSDSDPLGWETDGESRDVSTLLANVRDLTLISMQLQPNSQSCVVMDAILQNLDAAVSILENGLKSSVSAAAS